MCGEYRGNKVYKKCLLVGAATVSLLGTSNVAQGLEQTGADGVSDTVLFFEEIVVTAQKREQSINDVAEAVTALAASVLGKPQFQDLATLSDRVPSLTITSQFSNSNIISLRGLVPTNFRSSSSPLVATYIDDLPISEITTPNLAFYDLERIEVLRGPQGTLYGENSMGGTIKYVTKKPELGAFSGAVDTHISSTYQGGENFEANGFLNIPLAETLALRIVGSYRDDGGFIDDSNLGLSDVNGFERFGGRAALLFTPTDTFSARLTGFYQKYDGSDRSVVHPEEISGFTPPLATEFGEKITFKGVQENLEDELFVANLTLDLDIGPGTLTSASSYYKRDESRIRDERATTTAALDPLIFGFFGVYIDGATLLAQDRDVEVVSQELRYSFELDRLSGTAGFYYRNREETRITDTSNPAFGAIFSLLAPGYDGFLQDSDEVAEFEQYAAFAQVTYKVTDDLRITGGLRYYDETVSGSAVLHQIDPSLIVFTFNPNPADQQEDGILIKAGIEYDLNVDTLLYANFSQGFRPGGFNSRRNPFVSEDIAPSTFNADFVDSLDLGLKASLADGRVQANIAGFYIWHDDIQTLRNDTPPFSTTVNAASAESYGVEAEITANLGGGFVVGTSLSLIDAKYTADAVPDLSGGFAVYDNQPLPGTREETVTVFGEYRTPVFKDGYELFISADVSYASATNASVSLPGEAFYLRLDAYAVANVAVGLDTESWSASLFANNITDEFVGLGGNNYDGVARGRPRVVGLRLGARF